MRFYPTSNVDHYWEYPSSWTLYCHDPHKSWYRKPLQEKHAIAYWRDIEGAKKPLITVKDLYFEDWPHERIRSPACLPLYYAVGNRYIGIERAFPVGFKCTPLPISLKELRAIQDYDRQIARIKREKAAAAKLESQKQQKRG